MRLALILFIVFIVSCNSDGTKTDLDSVPDKDLISDTDSQDVTPDENPDPDIIDADNEKPDMDADSVECLDLKIQASVIKTGFPFKDKNGKPTFCRPGCDDMPTETDPQCVRNIWEWDNWEKYQKYLAAEKEDPEQKEERECYPWPCKLPDMKAVTGGDLTSKCDRWLSVDGYTSTMGAVWTHGMSDGVAGMYMSNGAIEYDPEIDQFVKIGQAMGRLSYNKKRYVILAFESMPSDNPDYKSFVVSVLRKDGKYYYELIYDNKDHNAFMGNPSFAGDEWVLIQICEGSSGPCDVKYAKAGVWEWHSLGLGTVYEGNIVGDRLTFMTPDETADRQIYYCDLSKYPKSYKECAKATRKNGSGQYEKGHSPRIDEDNKNRLIYYFWSDDEELKLIEVSYADQNNPAYNEIVIDRYMQPSKVKGNLMMFAGNKGYGLMSCYYRFDKKKLYCPESDEMMEFGIFDGKWHLWRDSIDVRIRDWDCYCEETGICPFEE
ncbi:MAG TPA: hypothetical protein P5044_02980 [bacterium]|nr:hypothetical protein [bacterium]